MKKEKHRLSITKELELERQVKLTKIQSEITDSMEHGELSVLADHILELDSSLNTLAKIKKVETIILYPGGWGLFIVLNAVRILSGQSIHPDRFNVAVISLLIVSALSGYQTIIRHVTEMGEKYDEKRAIIKKAKELQPSLQLIDELSDEMLYRMLVNATNSLENIEKSKNKRKRKPDYSSLIEEPGEHIFDEEAENLDDDQHFRANQ